VKNNSTDNPARLRPLLRLLPVLVAGVCHQGHGAESVLYGGGTGGEDDSIVFLGASVPFKGSTLGQGWVGKYWLDLLKYRYNSDNENISATAPGAEAALAYVGGGASGHYGLALGLAYRFTELDPDQPASDARGGVWGAKLQLDGGYDLSPDWQSSAVASYTTGSSLYWLSGKLLYRFHDQLSLGPELAVFGNPDFRTKQAGLLLSGLRLTGEVQLSLQAYLKKSRGFDAETALGISFSRLF
jgi:hypothetical protein